MAEPFVSPLWLECDRCGRAGESDIQIVGYDLLCEACRDGAQAARHADVLADIDRRPRRRERRPAGARKEGNAG